ncbi:MAG: tetratricopeptide repeat protein [Acidobacteriia bacterium]|nr:tetratricopeptide repeat protein [Terriglobia bacterium]
MGRSIGAPAVEATGRFYHKASDSTIVVRRHGSDIEHRVARHGVSASYPIAYSLGAGMVGYAYLVRIRDYLFQSPISFYTRTNTWDVAPGNEPKKLLDFTRQISSGCLFCHTGSVRLVAGRTNQFENPPFTAISCERCHGPSRRHLAKPVPGSIVNPAKLPQHERDNVCEQCHLAGAVRILNPGRDWWDYTPGDRLEKVFATYVEDAGSARLRAVSHYEQLAQSRCARESGGRMWCGTCHDPHGDKPNRPAQVRQACLSCHEPLFAAGKHAPATACVTCHMPSLAPADVAHSAITDHRIVRKPEPDRSPARVRTALRAWREPDSTMALRNLGIAYFDWAAREPDPDKLRRAYQLLSQLPPGARDPGVLVDLASVLLEQGDHRLAVQLFTQAAQAEPENARYAYCLGVAHERTGDFSAAIEELKRSIRLDPSQMDAYVELSRTYQAVGRPAQSQEAIRQYLLFMPQNLTLRSVD